jgi:hypothetical protein
VRLWSCAIILTITLFGILFGAGCSSTRHIAATERNLPPDDVLSRTLARDHRISTLQGEGSITIESPELSNSGSFDVDIRKPDSLRVKLNGPFGIYIGTLAMSPTQFVFFNARENIATVGQPDGRTLRSIFHITLKFDEILKAFTGEFLSSLSRDSLDNFSTIEDQYVFRFRSAAGIQEYRIDPDRFAVTSYRLLDADGKPSIIAVASRFDDDREIVMPGLVRVILPAERRSVTIAYSEIKTNVPVQCSFTIPQQAEVHQR